MDSESSRGPQSEARERVGATSPVVVPGESSQSPRNEATLRQSDRRARSRAAFRERVLEPTKARGRVEAGRPVDVVVLCNAAVVGFASTRTRNRRARESETVRAGAPPAISLSAPTPQQDHEKGQFGACAEDESHPNEHRARASLARVQPEGTLSPHSRQPGRFCQ